LVVVNAVSLYRQALDSADTAYDHTLLASAKAIGEQLEVVATTRGPALHADLPYSAMEAFEADNRSRLYYRVQGFGDEMVSGFGDLPTPRPGNEAGRPYSALVTFYDETYRDQPVRMAVLRQPVAGPEGQGMATIQVAETLELRRSLARDLLVHTLWQQALLMGLVAVVVVYVVQRATRPVRLLSEDIRGRDEADLSPLPVAGAPRELQPIVEATNTFMARAAGLLGHQKRFVRDASHQLRTPLAVLKVQVQSARRGDVAPEQALAEISVTVDAAAELVNQMLALAKVEQLRQQGTDEDVPLQAWDAVVRGVALDLAPLIADAGVDFDLQTEAAPVRAHEWTLRELTRNLLHNALKLSPAGRPLAVRLRCQDDQACLLIRDSGLGLPQALRGHLFQPFAAAGPRAGSGLGLAICHDIVQTLGGSLDLNNRPGRGLDATVRLPLNRAAKPT
jgi:two-component system sensor histidine kinase TctE